LLDLEKVKTTLFKRHAIKKDLGQLLRRTRGLDEELAALFLSYYFNGTELPRWRAKIINAMRRKNMRR